MKIEVLGTGCAKCKQMEKDVYNALAELNITADISKVEDIKKIMDYKVMITPALVIDGQVKVAGRLPKKDELLSYIRQAQA
ncbi:MAG: thioredoxin family protein [Desulfitobacteriaceae bacterium]|nr:thioredoxin family protein [Desulfitobacteriaceae bacterium]MDD4402193.1 thioredoxin family protein [Desulfitobacteriaceae bacterium]